MVVTIPGKYDFGRGFSCERDQKVTAILPLLPMLLNVSVPSSVLCTDILCLKDDSIEIGPLGGT